MSADNPPAADLPPTNSHVADETSERADEFFSTFRATEPIFARLRRRPGLVTLAVASAAIACALPVLPKIWPPTYTASALIKIEDTAPYTATAHERSDEISAMYIETQIELMRSPMVVELLLARPEIANSVDVVDSVDRMEFVRDRLKIQRVGNSELYEVKFTSQSPQTAATAANAAVAEYLTIQSRGAYERFQRVIDLLEDERRRRQLDVDRLRRRVMELSKEVTGRDPFGLGMMLDVKRTDSAVTEIYRQLIDIDVAAAVLHAQIQSRRESAHAGAVERPELAVWQTAIDNSEKILADFAAANPAAAENPAYVQLAGSVVAQRKALDQLKAALAVDAAAKTAATGDEPTIEDLERQIADLELKKKLLSRRFEEELSHVQSGNSKAVELTFARAELAREEKVFEAIANRKLSMQTESRSPARVTVQQKASIPTKPSVQYLSPGATAAAVVGLLALAVVALVAAARESQPAAAA